MPLTIADLIERSHRTAVEHGWWEDPRSVGDCIALMHSELSEALEEHRSGMPPAVTAEGSDGKLVGIPIELADVVIRVADFCGHHGIDLEAALEAKLAYNQRRPYRHGGKAL